MDFFKGMLTTTMMWMVWPLVVGIALYWYFSRSESYFEKAGIPHVKSFPIVGSVLQMFTGAIQDVALKYYREKGRIYGLYQGTTKVLMVGEPDILRDILVKDFQFFTGRRRFDIGVPEFDNMLGFLQGEDWKRVRSIITPAFSTGKIRRMISVFIDAAKTLTDNFKTAARGGRPVDMKRFFGAFAMDVIASTAFATKLDSQNDPDNPFVVHAKGAFVNPFPWRIIMFFIFPGFMRFFKISIFDPKAMKFFRQLTFQIVEERKRTKQRRNDFLQILLDAVDREKETDNAIENDEITQMGHAEGNEEIFKSYQSSRSLSNIEMVANAINFFLAGYDTTASTLTFAAFELAVNPDIQDKLIAEIDEVIRAKGELNYEALCEMKYLDNVISETLRKYPPAVGSERLAEEDYEIKNGDMRITVQKGMVVGIPIYAMHHDPKNYPDPEIYDPDRFTPEQRSTRHPYTYQPFGAGPRNCVGMRFALMEIKACLAAFLSQCRVTTCSQTTIPIQFGRGGTGVLQPKPVFLKVQTRSDSRKI